MEKYEVLEKFFSVNNGVQEYRKKRREEQLKLNLQKSEMVEKDVVEKLSPTSKNILILLLSFESMNQRTIAKSVDVSSQAVSETIKKLEQSECITKTIGAVNNENIISLTKKGVELAKTLKVRLERHADVVFENFTNSDLETLSRLLEKMKSTCD
ncbi:MAG: MarR family winged helix-turn-helix transcriptional regulator [Bacillota bacterium]